MTFKMSEHPQTIKIYNLSAGTNEFIGEGDAWIPPHTGLPAHSTDIAPPDIPEGHVAIFDEDENTWHLMEDHRGKTVWRLESGSALLITEPGPLPENVTIIKPEGEFCRWDGSSWAKDEAAEQAYRVSEAENKKRELIQEATNTINILQDAVDLNMATDDESALLPLWKKYRVLLSRTDTGNAPDIVWPESPSPDHHAG
ncbi:tail fiber assembly protein [Escherichia coli]|uniref:tail fiber assembly protein n=1 Tax=Escherichia coli TaxID=562 RepID=UPI00287AD9A9|nr:tail fiber assembly protein [Escherichia coli]MDS1613495.1 tail fiber assembly protein [Escherichia coli]MDS1676699.1 tail fiber assembly protein [Escherichia coli]